MSENERASLQTSASSGGPRRMARLINGEPIWQEVTQDEMAAYTPPPSDKYHVKITGIGETWKRAKHPDHIKPGGPTEDTLTRLEFEIQEGRGKGRKFTAIVNFVVGPKSNLGQVWLAAVGPIPPTCEVMDLLGKELVLYVERTKKIDENGNKQVYAKPTWSTARSVSSESTADDEWPAA